MSLSASQQEFVTGLLKELVAIPSVNESVEQAERDRCEEAMAQRVTQELLDMGMCVREVELAPGRPQHCAHWPDGGNKKRVALQAHLDTVSVGNMTIPPFDPQVRDGRLFGRGSCDTKGSMAAFLAALRFAGEKGTTFADEIHFIATAGEETCCLGAAKLVADGLDLDAIVVGEPTHCQIVTAHKGAVWFKLAAAGRGAHASTPEKGRNAIDVMSRAIQHIHDEFAPKLAEVKHDQLSPATIAVTMIQAGLAPNILPHRCVAQLDSRFGPSQNGKQIVADLTADLRSAFPKESFEMFDVLSQSALERSPESAFAKNLMNVTSAKAGQTAPIGVNYFTDAGPFSSGDIQSIVFGPGDIAQAHTADEFIDLDELFLATEIALNWLENHRERSFLD